MKLGMLSIIPSLTHLPKFPGLQLHIDTIQMDYASDNILNMHLHVLAVALKGSREGKKRTKQL